MTSEINVLEQMHCRSSKEGTENRSKTTYSSATTNDCSHVRLGQGKHSSPKKLPFTNVRNATPIITINRNPQPQFSVMSA
jgi:hypothetical protein